MEQCLSSYRCDECQKDINIAPNKDPFKRYWYHKRNGDVDYCSPCFSQLKSQKLADYSVIDLYQDCVVETGWTRSEHAGVFFFNITPPQKTNIPSWVQEKIKKGNHFLSLLHRFMTNSLLLEFVVSLNSSVCDPEWRGHVSTLDSFDPTKFGSLKNWLPFEAEHDIFFCFNIAEGEPLYGTIACGVLDESGNLGMDIIYKNKEEMEADRSIYLKENESVNCDPHVLDSFGEWCRKKYWLSNCFLF